MTLDLRRAILALKETYSSDNKAGADDGSSEFVQIIGLLDTHDDWRNLLRAYGLATVAGLNFKGTEHVNRLEKLIEARIEAHEDGLEKNYLYVALGDLQLHWKDDREKAMKSYQAAFASSREATICLDRARKIYATSGEFDRVISLLKHEIKLSEDPARKGALFLELAQVYVDEKDDFEVARKILKSINKLPHDEHLAQELGSLYQDNVSLKGFLDVLVTQASETQSEEPQKAALDYLQAAQIEAGRPTGLNEIAVTYAARAVNLDPTNEEARILLRQFHHGHERLIWPPDEELEDDVDIFYDQINAALKELGEGEEKADEGSIDTAENETVTEEKVAEEVAHAEDVEASETQESESEESVEESSVEEDETTDESEVSEADAAAETQKLAAIEDVEKTREMPRPEPKRSAKSARRSTSGRKTDLSAELVKGTTEEILEGLAYHKGLLMNEGETDEAVALYEKAVKRLRKKEAELPVMAELARFLWLDLENYERADYYFKRLKVLDPDNRDVETFYAEYYERTGDYRKLLVLLMNAAAEAESEEEKRNYTRRLANLSEVTMGSLKTAIDAWRSFLKEYERDEEAITELKRLYVEDSKWAPYVDLLRSEFDALSDDEVPQKIAILEDIRKVYAEHLHIEPLLIATLHELLALDPNNVAAFEHLRERLIAGRLYTDLAVLLEQRAKRAEEEGLISVATEYYLEVADLWQSTLRNVSNAIPHIEHVLQLDPENQTVLDRAIDIYGTRRDYASVVRLKQKKAQSVGEDEAVDLLFEAAKLAQERLRDYDKVASILEDLIKRRPEDAEVMATLKQIYDRGDDYEKQVSIRRHILEYGYEQDERDVLREIAQLHSQRLQDPKGAIEAWEALLHVDPQASDAVQALTLLFVQESEFKRLEDLYLEQNRPLLLYDILEGAADQSEDEARRAKIFMQMADLAETTLQDEEKAILSLESYKEIVEPAVDAARRLCKLYATSNDINGEIEQLVYLIDHNEDDAHDTLHIRLRGCYLEAGKREEAFEIAKKIVVSDPLNEDGYEAARQIAESPEEKASLVIALDKIANEVENEELVHLYNLRAAQLLVETGDYEDGLQKGIARYNAILESRPEDLASLSQLADALGEANQPHQQIEKLEELVALKRQDPAKSREVIFDLSRIAEIEMKSLGETEKAERSYLDILDIAPDHLPSLRGLESIYRAQGDHQNVYDTLLRIRESLSYNAREEKIEVLYQLGEVAAQHLDDPDATLEYAQDALSLEPKHEPTRALVTSLFDNEQVAYDAALLLAPYLRQEGATEKLIETLDVRRRHSSDTFEQLDLIEQTIELVLKSVDEDATPDIPRAFNYATQAISLDPSREETWDRLANLAERGAQLGLEYEDQSFYEALESAYQHALDEGPEPQAVVSLLKRLTELSETKLKSHEKAIERLLELHDIDNFDLYAIDGLIRNYEAIESIEPLAEMIAEKAAVISEPEEQKTLYLRAAELADLILEDAEKTEHYLRELHQAQPTELDVQRRLITLLEREEKWEDLAEQINQLIPLETAPESRSKLLKQLASVQSYKLGEEEEAVRTYQSLLETVGYGDAKPLILAFDDHLAEQSNVHPLRLEIVELLEPLAREKTDRKGLVRLLETRLLTSDDSFQRSDLFNELSHLYHELGRPQDVFEAARQAFLANPENEERRQRFEDLAVREDEPARFVESYLEAIDKLDDPFLAANMLVKVADWQLKKLDQEDEAIESLNRALAFDETHLGAVRQLISAYERRADFESLARLLKMATLLEVEASARTRAFRRLAVLQNQFLDQPEDAISSWNEVLQSEPNDFDAIMALEQLYESESRFVDLTEIINRKIELSHDEVTRFESLQKLAQVYETELGDKASAIQELQRAHKLRPTNTEILFELKRLLREESLWQELDGVLQKLIANDKLQRDPELKAQLLLEQGDLRATELFEVEKAIPTYLRLLRYDVDSLRNRAVDALEQISTDSSYLDQIAEPLSSYNVANARWSNEVELTKRLIEHANDADRRALLYQRLADLHGEYLNDPEASFDAILLAWRETPHNLSYYQRAQANVFTLNKEVELVEALVEQLPRINDPKRLVDLRLDLAHLYLEALQNRIEGEQVLRDILLVDRTNEVALAQLEQLLIEDSRWFDLIELDEQRYELVLQRRGPEVASEVLFEIAQIYRHKIEDNVATIDTYRRLLESHRGHQQARTELLELLREEGRWAELVELIGESKPFFGPDELRLRKLELAKIEGEELQNPIVSLQHYADLLTPNSGFTLPHDSEEYESAYLAVECYLTELDYAHDTVLQQKAGYLLLPIYERRGNWTRYAETREVLARGTEDENERLNNLIQSADTYEYRLGEIDEARRLRYEILNAYPGDLQYLSGVMALCHTTEDWEDFALRLYDLLQEVPTIDSETRQEMASILAETYEVRLQDPDRAIDYISERYENDPTDQRAAETLERLLTRKQDWPELAALFRKEADFAESNEFRYIYLYRLVYLHEAFTKDYTEAIDLLTELQPLAIALEEEGLIEDGQQKVTNDLMRLLRLESRWNDLVDLLTSQAETQGRTTYPRQLAEIYINELEQYDDAVDVLEDMIAKHPEDYDVRRQLRSLQRLLAARGAETADLQLRIVDLLIMHRPAQLPMQMIIELLEIRVSIIDDIEERADTYLRIGDLLEHRPSLNERLSALNALANAYQIRPNDTSIFTRLSNLADKTESWERVPTLLLPGLRRLEVPEDQVKLLTAIAWIFRDKLNDVTSTIIALQAVIDLDPSSSDALDALEESFRANRQWGELIRILEIRIVEEQDPDRRRESLESLARLNHTVVDRPIRAIDNYVELRELDPTNIQYMESLEELYKSHEMWFELEETLADHLNCVEEPKDRMALLLQLGDVQRLHTENLDGAMTNYAQLLELDPKNDEANLALIDLYRRAELWVDLLDVLAHRIERTTEPAERLNYRVEAAAIRADHTSEEEAAFQELRTLLKTEPEPKPVIELLKRLAQRVDTHQEAKDIAVKYFKSNERIEELEAFYIDLIEALDRETFAEQRKGLYLELIKLYAEIDPEKGEMTAQLAVEDFQNDVDILAAYTEMTPSDEAKGRRLEHLAELVSQDADQHTYRPTLELIATTKEELGQLEAARDDWREILALDPFSPTSLAALDRILVKLEAYDDLSEILQTEIQVADPADVAPLRARLAELYETHLDRRDEANEIFADLLELDPEDERALHGLTRLYQDDAMTAKAAVPLSAHFRQKGAFQDLAATIQGALPLLDPYDQITWRQELIELCLNELNEEKGGFFYLLEAIAAEPNNIDQQLRAEELAPRVEGEFVLAQAYASIESYIDDPMRRIDILNYAGQRLLHVDEEIDLADALFERVLEIEPENLPALNGLEEIARRRQDVEKLIATLNRKAESVFDNDIQVATYLEIARLYVGQEMNQEALEAYRQGLSIAPDHVEIMDEMAALLEIEKEYGHLVDLLAQEVECVDDAAKKEDIYVRAAQFTQFFLDDPHRAIGFWEEAHQLQPRKVETLQALDELYKEVEAVDQRRDTLEKLVENVSTDELRVKYQTEVGSLFDTVYNDYPRAKNYLIRAYELSKKLPPEVAQEIDTFDKLQNVYANHQKWTELNELFEQRLADLPENAVDARIELQARRADISAKHLGDVDQAITSLQELLVMAPGHTKTLMILADLYKTKGETEKREETIDAILRHVKTDEEKIKGLKLRVELNQDLGRNQKVINDLNELLKLNPNDSTTRKELKTFYEQEGNWDKYLDILEEEARGVEDKGRRNDLLQQAYKVAKDKLKSPTRTVEILEELVKEDGSSDLYEKLIDAYLNDGRVEKAESMISEAIERLTAQRKMRDVVRYYHLRGKLAEQKGESDLALEAYREAHGADATYLPNLISLGKLLIDRDEWDEALKIYQTLLLHQMNVKDKDEKIAIYYNLGLIRAHQGDQRRAKDMFKRALSIDKTHAPSQEELAKLS